MELLNCEIFLDTLKVSIIFCIFAVKSFVFYQDLSKRYGDPRFKDYCLGKSCGKAV